MTPPMGMGGSGWLGWIPHNPAEPGKNPSPSRRLGTGITPAGLGEMSLSLLKSRSMGWISCIHEIPDDVELEAQRWRSPAAESGSGANAVSSQVQRFVRCSTGAEERPRGSLVQEARAYGQSRGVIPFSCAYLAA